jgi:hypothetical protein
VADTDERSVFADTRVEAVRIALVIPGSWIHYVCLKFIKFQLTLTTRLIIFVFRIMCMQQCYIYSTVLLFWRLLGHTYIYNSEVPDNRPYRTAHSPCQSVRSGVYSITVHAHAAKDVQRRCSSYCQLGFSTDWASCFVPCAAVLLQCYRRMISGAER